jgi:RimJ/RimL family protein N-acetyltransferase
VTITIEEITPERFELVARWLSQPDINRWLTGEWRGRDVTSTNVAMAVRNKRNRIFVVCADGSACGVAALADLDVSDHTAMLWYLLGEVRFAGEGVISEAVRQLVSRSFRQFELRSVFAWVMEDNAASIRVLQKVGFREVGRIRQATCSNGRQVDRIYFDLISEEA